MVFTGTFEHSIDAKNRIAIPAEIRTLLDGDSVGFFVTVGEAKSLCLYTEAGFTRRAEELLNRQAEDQLLTFERLWFSFARRVELDTAGRIRLPEPLIKRAQLENEVVLLGVNDHLEVRDRRSWYEYVEQVLAEQPQIIVNPRRAIKRSSEQG